MKIFNFKLGDASKIAVFKDAEEAFERRAELEPTYHWLPVQITEFTVEGYDITVKPTPTPTDTPEVKPKAPSATLKPAAKK